MPLLRLICGLASLLTAGLLLNAAMQRFLHGVALLFAGAVALAVGALLVGSSIWTALRRRRKRRATVEEEEEPAVG